MADSEEHGAELFLRLVESFTPEDHPRILLLTGGEPLLRPALVRTITELAHAAGTEVMLISGMFFARQRRIPRAIREAIDCVDHFTASLDTFHEQQVGRDAVLRVLGTLVDAGKDVSLQVIGLNAGDPYLAEVTRDAREALHDRVPMLVGQVGYNGRARDWLAPPETAVNGGQVSPDPCYMAAWPVVTFDGTVVACCNQTVVDGPPPSHLRVGHTTVDTWGDIRRRVLTSTHLRALRVFGPNYVAERFGGTGRSCGGYCETCYSLGGDEMLEQRLAPVMARPTMPFVEAQVQNLPAVHFSSLSGLPEYAHLATLGYQQDVACAV
jgi:hypothetical protein